MSGTPKTLEEAIANGLCRAEKPIQLSGAGTLASVEAHVRDYLAQVLGAALLSASTSKEEALIERICLRVGIKATVKENV